MNYTLMCLTCYIRLLSQGEGSAAKKSRTPSHTVLHEPPSLMAMVIWTMILGLYIFMCPVISKLCMHIPGKCKYSGSYNDLIVKVSEDQ